MDKKSFSMVLVLMFVFTSLTVFAISEKVSYAGIGVKDLVSGNLLNGSYTVITRTYYVAAGGVAQSTDSSTVLIENGNFVVTFNFSNDDFNKTFWVEPEIGGDLYPRFEYTPSAQSVLSTDSVYDAVGVGGAGGNGSLTWISAGSGLLGGNITIGGVFSVNDSYFAKFNDTAAINAALVTNFYNVTSYQVITGSSTGGLAQINAYNGNSFNLTESAGDYEARFNFTNITDFNQLVFRVKSSVSGGDSTDVSIWNYNDNAWESYKTFQEVTDYNIFSVPVFDSSDHVLNGTVQVRIYTNNVPVTTHTLYIDWLTISKGVSTPSASETDPYSIHKDGSVSLTANWNAAYNITAPYFLGNLNASYILNSYWASKTANEVISGSWNFTSASGVYFSGSGNIIFDSPVFFKNNVTLTTPQTLTVNQTLVLFDTGNTARIKLNVTGTTGNITANNYIGDCVALGVWKLCGNTTDFKVTNSSGTSFMSINQTMGVCFGVGC